MVCLSILTLLSGLRCFAGPSWRAGPWRSRGRRGSKPSSARAPAPPSARACAGMRLSEALADARASSWSSRTRPAWRRSGKRCGELEGGGLRSRAGRAGVRLLPDPGHGAACRRARAGTQARARRRGAGVRGRVWAQPPVASRRSPRRPWRRPVAPSSSTTARRTSSSEPLPLDVLPALAGAEEELSGLGVKRLGSWHASPGTAVADRLGADGAEAWRLARGEATPPLRRAVRRPSWWRRWRFRNRLRTSSRSRGHSRR